MGPRDRDPPAHGGHGAGDGDRTAAEGATTRSALGRLGWFVALWLGGVATVSLVALALRRLIAG